MEGPLRQAQLLETVQAYSIGGATPMSILRDRKHLRWGSGSGSGCCWGRGRRATLHNTGQSLSFLNIDGGAGWFPRLSKDHRALGLFWFLSKALLPTRHQKS